MEKIKAIVAKYQDNIVAAIQLLICVIFAGKVVDKEVKQRLKFAQKNAKNEAKRTEKLRKILAKDARKLAGAEYKLKRVKVNNKIKKNKLVGKIRLQKYKDKLKAAEVKSKKAKTKKA